MEISPLFAVEAEELLEEGKTQEAIDLCLAGLEVYPGYPTGEAVLAKAYKIVGDEEKANERIEKAISKKPLAKSFNAVRNSSREELKNTKKEKEFTKPEEKQLGEIGNFDLSKFDKIGKRNQEEVSQLEDDLIDEEPDVLESLSFEEELDYEDETDLESEVQADGGRSGTEISDIEINEKLSDEGKLEGLDLSEFEDEKSDLALENDTKSYSAETEKTSIDILPNKSDDLVENSFDEFFDDEVDESEIVTEENTFEENVNYASPLESDDESSNNQHQVEFFDEELVGFEDDIEDDINKPFEEIESQELEAAEDEIKISDEDEDLVTASFTGFEDETELALEDKLSESGDIEDSEMTYEDEDNEYSDSEEDLELSAFDIDLIPGLISPKTLGNGDDAFEWIYFSPSNIPPFKNKYTEREILELFDNSEKKKNVLEMSLKYIRDEEGEELIETAEELEEKLSSEEIIPTVITESKKSTAFTPTLAEIYFEQGAIKDAVGIYKKLIEMYPEREELYQSRIKEIKS